MHVLCATHTLAPVGALSAQIPTERAHFESIEVILTESQGQNLALTVLSLQSNRGEYS